MEGEVLHVARIRTLPTFEVIDQTVVVPQLQNGDRYLWDYEVHPDGRRLLMVHLLKSEQRSRQQLIVVENFFEELKAKVPR